MAEPQIKLISPLDPRLKENRSVPTHVPANLVKALIHGLLSHLWSSNRRRTKEMGVNQAQMEKMLFQYVTLGTNNASSLSQERLLEIFETSVPLIFEACTGHSYFLFAGQSDLILQGLAPYEKISAYDKRVQWLKAEVPGFLEVLKGFSPCTECRGKGKTSIPSIDRLETWAASPNVGELRNNIIGHYHQLTATTVKRILSSNPLNSVTAS